MTRVRIESEAAEAAAGALSTPADSPSDRGAIVPMVSAFPPAAAAIEQLAAHLDATEATIRSQRRAAVVELRAVAHEAIAADT